MIESHFKDNKKENILLLLRRAIEGDKFAFDQIYELYFTPIFRYIYFRVKNREDAEDLVQTVFLKAWKAIANFKEKETPFSSWLYKIAKNIVIDYWRKGKNYFNSDSIEVLNETNDKGANPEIYFNQQEKSEIIRQVIKQLSEDQQEVIILKFIDELSNQEIAEILNKKEEAVRALQCRGLKALREKFKKSNLLSSE